MLITATEIIDFQNIPQVKEYYERGFLFGRKDAGFVYQTRSLRVNLNNFTP